MKPDDIQQWAWDQAVKICWPIIWLNADAEQSAHEAIARALLDAERRGMEKMVAEAGRLLKFADTSFADDDKFLDALSAKANEVKP